MIEHLFEAKKKTTKKIMTYETHLFYHPIHGLHVVPRLSTHTKEIMRNPALYGIPKQDIAKYLDDNNSIKTPHYGKEMNKHVLMNGWSRVIISENGKELSVHSRDEHYAAKAIDYIIQRYKLVNVVFIDIEIPISPVQKKHVVIRDVGMIIKFIHTVYDKVNRISRLKESHHSHHTPRILTYEFPTFAIARNFAKAVVDLEIAKKPHQDDTLVDVHVHSEDQEEILSQLAQDYKGELDEDSRPRGDFIFEAKLHMLLECPFVTPKNTIYTVQELAGVVLLHQSLNETNQIILENLVYTKENKDEILRFIEMTK